ncbi:MAG TPA: transglycosylase SLT domain-containing protein [Rhodanobacteraceae bacterium]|nr:transglycosylase SLT domain-containing protein [Rhodanobacteraceae bacterium]
MNAAPLLPMPRRIAQPLRGVACLFLLLICAASVCADDLQSQRDTFRAAYAAAYAGRDWRPLARGLETYPLYPYLEATALERDIAHADRGEVQAYLARYPDLIPADDLRREELQWLAQQHDWNGFRSFYKPGLGDALTCDGLQAQLARGTKLDFQRDLAALWSEAKLPGECDAVLQTAAAQGLLTPTRVWERIDRAAEANAPSTIEQSAAWLPPDRQDAARRLAKALRDPAALLAQADTLSDDARARQALTIALRRYAHRHDDEAEAAWKKLSARFAFDTEQRDRILNALALYSATDFEPDALAKLASLPPAAQTDATREWRVRVALANRDWNGAQSAIAALTPDEMQHDEWRYWQARVADKLGHADEARANYAALAQQATYYGFLAADRAGLPYSICPEQLVDDPAAQQRVLNTPGFARAFEFFALDMLQPARREWSRAFANLADADQRAAAELAWKRGWYDRAVFAFGNEDDLRLYEQRFPLADKDDVIASARTAGIDPAWAFAIIRAESAWQTDAHSGADAYGLMQLLPGTAANLARQSGLPYDAANDLYDPRVNIPLGTQYLAAMALRFDGSPWLASAAYNAGPIPVQRWVDARGGLEPDVFIATIPYQETREYVARVLSFTTMYDWRLHGDALPVSSRMPAIGTAYESGSSVPRKQVVCHLDADNAGRTAAMPATPASKSSVPSSSTTATRNIH